MFGKLFLVGVTLMLVLPGAAANGTDDEPPLPPLPGVPDLGVNVICAGLKSTPDYIVVTPGQCAQFVTVSVIPCTTATICVKVCVTLDGWLERCEVYQGGGSCDDDTGMCYYADAICVPGVACVPYNFDLEDGSVCWNGGVCAPLPTRDGDDVCLEEWFCIVEDEHRVYRFQPGPRMR